MKLKFPFLQALIVIVLNFKMISSRRLYNHKFGKTLTSLKGFPVSVVDVISVLPFFFFSLKKLF